MNKEKEILLICKHHYSDKFKSTYDALKAYQARYTDGEEIYISDENILAFVLDTARLFLSPFDWYWLIKDGFVHDINMAATGLIPVVYPEKEIKLTYRYLIEKLATSLCMLQVKDENGWIIDLSEYDGIESII